MEQPTPAAAQPAKQKMLTPEQVAQVEEWLGIHWTNSGCPFHGPTKWSVGKLVGSVQGLTATDWDAGGQQYPVITVICNTCGFMVLMGALRIGIVIPPKPEPIAKQEGG
jgi:hypothetical protein